jgi:thiamine-phosphate pyrophosphorylase
MITDRRRYGASWQRRVVEQVTIAARSGVALIQIRERDLEGGALVALTRACVAAVRGTEARVLVSDRVDVALAAGAHGVHLPAAGARSVRVRTVAPRPFLIGRSVHTVDEARGEAQDGAIDYLLFGTVFASASKPGVRPAGVDALAGVASAVQVPVLAVGGMTGERIAEICLAGAAGAAAISLFAEATLFDTPGAVP